MLAACTLAAACSAGSPSISVDATVPSSTARTTSGTAVNDPGPTGGSLIVGLADDVVAHFTTSRYRHRRQPAKTDTSGTFETDCSGFVDYLLTRLAPQALGGVPVDAGHTHALAHNFAELPTPNALPAGWQQVTTVADLRPGDLIAWTEPLDVNTDDTGHVMVVDAAVTASGTPHQFDVTVVDSTASPHGANDTRDDNPRNQPDQRTQKPSGVGRGTITLITDAEGRPTRYRWSTASKKTEKPDRLTLLRLDS